MSAAIPGGVTQSRVIMRILRVGFVFAVSSAGLIGGQHGSLAKDKDEVVSAVAIAKVYAESKEAFDKTYKGKTLTVEGVVSISSAKDAGKTYLILDGYTKPGDKFAHIVRFVES